MKLVFFALIFIGPGIAHAGFFSTVSGWFSSASADASSTNTNDSATGSKINLLEAVTNQNPTGLATTTDTLSVVDGQALLNEAGVSGTMADVVDRPVSSDQISVYVVRKGDTLSSIAKMYGVSVNTVKWANDLKGTPKEGDILTILPISGIQYTVKKGDTVASIAKKYKADIADIQQYNDLSVDSGLIIGDVVIIPDAEISTPVITPVKKYTNGSSALIPGASGPSYAGYYIRPFVGGRKTQGLHGHNGVDLAGVPVGTPIKAAADGVVIIAKMGGYNGGYGNYIVISHPNGTQTLYGHLNSISISRGDQVNQGQVIGGLGNTGRSTGPHLHFEVRGAVNPF